MPSTPKLLTTILWAGFIVGYLDITAAIINFMFNSSKSPVIIFNYIASAAFGKQRAYSETAMVSYGVIFHFLIAYCFTVFFLLIYPRVKFLSAHRLVTGVLYGCFVWCVMNLLVVPSSKINQYPEMQLKTLVQLAILILAIGLPLSYIAHWHYQTRKAKRAEDIV